MGKKKKKPNPNKFSRNIAESLKEFTSETGMPVIVKTDIQQIGDTGLINVSYQVDIMKMGVEE